MNLEHFLWEEKYRPNSIDDCILTADQREYFNDLVTKEQIPNLLLSGSPGCGKTTVAKALCEQIGLEYLFLNGSENSGIDTLRNTIREFASTRAFNGKIKVVIIDEADYLNPNSFQPAFRAFTEEFASNCRFILTCNYKNRIIPSLRDSRFTTIEFKIEQEEKPIIAKKFFKRILTILKTEEVEANNDVIAAIIQRNFPDFRQTIVQLQRNVINGKISERLLSNEGNIDTIKLKEIFKKKDWKGMRQWVVDSIDNDPRNLFRTIYDNLLDHTDQAPLMVTLIGEYQYKSAFVADQEINLVAFLTEVMANCTFEK